jgi:glycosyltransferase involved in cell wall biosynthesis
MSARSLPLTRSDPAAVRILCLTNMYPGPGEPDYGAFVRDMCDALEDRGQEVRRAVIDSRARGPLNTPRKYGRLTTGALASARWADVIYAHYLFPTGAIAAVAGRIARRPWVVTAHGGDVANLHRATVRSATAAGLAGATAVIAVSHYLADRLAASGLRLPPVFVANMGVNMAGFTIRDRAEARSRRGLAPSGPVIVAVGGLTERKDPLTLLLAFARLRATLPDAQLVFVGDGPLRSSLVGGAERLGIAGAVTLTGAIPHEDVADWMAAGDLLALVSRVEPLGIVVLEALACGRPVVATQEGGAREVIPPDCGALVPPGNPVVIADTLLKVIAQHQSPAVCRMAAERFALTRQAAIVDDVLTGAVGGTLPDANRA